MLIIQLFTWLSILLSFHPRFQRKKEGHTTSSQVWALAWLILIYFRQKLFIRVQIVSNYQDNSWEFSFIEVYIIYCLETEKLDPLSIESLDMKWRHGLQPENSELTCHVCSNRFYLMLRHSSRTLKKSVIYATSDFNSTTSHCCQIPQRWRT